MTEDVMHQTGSRWLRYGAGLVAVAALAGLGSGAAVAVPTPTVQIKDFTYGPAVLQVPVGTAVTWINRDEEPHTVTSTTGAFASGGLVNGETFGQRFTRPGTYQYACALHPQMRATVIVK
jgi:plastocyanin